MTLAQIRCFLAVAEYRSFSRAAAHMFISQPAVSKQIRLLENDLKLPLLDRSSSVPKLTGSGELLYRFFRESSEEFSRVLEQAGRLGPDFDGALNVGCLDGWDVTALYPELELIARETAPGRRLKLFGFNHLQLTEKLLSGEIDLAIGLDISLRRRPELRVRRLLTVPLVLLISRQHPLAERESLCLRDFREEPIYVIAPAPDGENAMEELIVSVCEAEGFSPLIEHTSTSAGALMRLQSSAGAQITTAMTAACKLPSCRPVILTRMTEVSVAWVENGQKPDKLSFADELCVHYAANLAE